MGFGIKTKVLQIARSIQKPTFIYDDLTTCSFPQQSHSKFKINSRLKASLKEVVDTDLDHNIGSIAAKVNQYAAEVFQRFVEINPNNIGGWSSKPPIIGTRQLEYEVIHKLLDLYKCRRGQNYEGYVTSGGSEGNLFSVWVGKAAVIRKRKLDQICLLKTQLTHYSIDKSCKMYSIQSIDVPLNINAWNMDPESLEKEMIKQVKKGITGFIVSLTFGYSETGTSDNLQRISDVVQKIESQFKNVTVSIIIDAALNGLVEPFITDNFQPFNYKNVDIFSTDFSKFTAVPFPAGAVIYRGHLKKLIEQKVPVFPMPDNTLLGSRPGASVAAIWAVIHRYGVSGYKKIISRQLGVKNYFIEEMLKLFPDSVVINDEKSLGCAIIFNKKHYKILRKVSGKYWISSEDRMFYFNKNVAKKIRMFKFFFLSHITRKAISDIISTIKSAQASS